MTDPLQRWLPALAIAALGVMALPAAAEPALWTVEGRGNRVWLFGSVHVLPKDGFAIDGALAGAWAEAERVCLEVDSSALDEATTAGLTLAMAVDPDGRSLYDLMGDKADRARALATMAGIELAQFAAFEPWFVGLTVAVVALQQHGYDVAHGVEKIIEQAAAKDGKGRCGLESLEEQLGFLDGLAPELQQEILLQSLAEADEVDEAMQQLLSAWQAGDTRKLLVLLEEDFEEFPGLADRLVYERNERWAEALAGKLEGGDDVLVVVGALHLVGDRGLPALLQKRGFKVRRH
ncbi:MAG: TraB/GumN family protein [Gammaproteobacteria bacterium]